MKRLFIFAFLFASLHGSEFEELMGPSQYVRTQEDRENVAFYKALYDREKGEKGTIPKSFHIIWLGPDPFPAQSIKRLKKWQALHSDWTFHFWTDVMQKPPFSFLIKRSVVDFDLSDVNEAYDAADTFKEKAFLLSLEVLAKEGGVYIDHDVTPLQSLDALHEGLDFYASLAPLRPSLFSSSVMVAPHLLAGCACHPFFSQAMGWYRENGKLYKEFSRIRRTEQRIYEALSSGAKHLGEKRDRVFPARELALFAKHEEVAAWKQLETIREQKMRKKIEMINRKLSGLMVLVILSVTIALLTFLFPRRAG